MVRVSRKTIKGGTYFYIAKSIRMPDGKVTTITKSVPKGVEKKSGRELYKKYNDFFMKKEVSLNQKWAANNYNKTYIFSEDEIRKIEEMRVYYKYLIKKLSKPQLKDVFDRFTANFTYDSNAIEGNSMTLKDVSVVIFDNANVPGKSLREIFETKNSRKVVEMVLRRGFSVDIKDIIRMHGMLVKDIDVRRGFKKIPNVIFHAEREVHTTQPELVESEMKDLIKWYNSNSRMHPLERAAVFHGRFEKMHPFEDGNGRVGRFLINAILINHGYPPIIIRKTSRRAYMSALAAFDNGHNDRLKRFLLEKYKETYRKFFEVYVRYL